MRGAGAFVTDGILLCDKPPGRSSHQVVALLRRALGTAKVGHAGTLDPMATGLLVLGVGEGLKVLRYLTLDDKRYRATVRLGWQTETLDAEGVETERAPLPTELTRERVERACAGFLGEFEQEPPAISAIKLHGVPLYKRARRGEDVVAPARRVTVHAIEVHAVREDEIELTVDCGKGFYVRSLARDLARALGTVGHLASLRRLRSGAFDVADAWPMREDLRDAQADPVRLRALLDSVLPIERALPCAPALLLDAAGSEHARHGRNVPLTHVLAGLPAGAGAGDVALEPVLLRGDDGRLLALARCVGATLTVVRGLRLAPAVAHPP